MTTDLPREVDETAQERAPVDDDRTSMTYLEQIPEGSGCVEIWEHLSEERGEDTAN